MWVVFEFRTNISFIDSSQVCRTEKRLHLLRNPRHLAPLFAASEIIWFQRRSGVICMPSIDKPLDSSISVPFIFSLATLVSRFRDRRQHWVFDELNSTRFFASQLMIASISELSSVDIRCRWDSTARGVSQWSRKRISEVKSAVIRKGVNRIASEREKVVNEY